MMFLWCFVLVCNFINLNANEDLNSLQKALDKVLPLWGIDAGAGLKQRGYEGEDEKVSSIGSMCSGLERKEDNDRIGCCKPHNVQYLHNVLVKQKDIVYFRGNSSSHPQRTPKLYPVANVEKRNSKTFQLNVVMVQSNYDPNDRNKCPSHVGGTLHVMGRQTVGNLFHVLNDNVLPMLSQIVLDAHYFPEYLSRPRHILFAPTNPSSASGLSPPPDNGPSGTRTGTKAKALPHMQFLNSLASKVLAEGGTDTTDACYDRVVWGSGVRLVYNHALVELRRQTVQVSGYKAMNVRKVFFVNIHSSKHN